MINDQTVFQNLTSAELEMHLPKANSVFHDDRFDVKIVRATDRNTSDKFFSTSSAGQSNCWNTTSELFWLTSQGGQKFIFQFVKGNSKVLDTTIRYNGQLCFSRKVANVLFRFIGTKINAITFKKVDGIWHFASEKTLYDFAKILPTGYDIVWTSNFLCSVDDNTFTVSVSEDVQGSAHLVCCWRRAKGGQLIDTLKYTSKAFHIHAVYQTPNPNFVNIVASDKDINVIWDITKKTFSQISIGGHLVNGLDNILGGGLGNGQWAGVPYINPALQPKPVIPEAFLPDPPLVRDKHGSWNSVRLGTGTPFLVSIINNGAENNTAWQGEIIRINPVSGQVMRICQHFAKFGNEIFNISNAIASQSQDGKYVLYGSDLMTGVGGDCYIATTF